MNSASELRILWSLCPCWRLVGGTRISGTGLDSWRVNRRERQKRWTSDSWGRTEALDLEREQTPAQGSETVRASALGMWLLRVGVTGEHRLWAASPTSHRERERPRDLEWMANPSLSHRKGEMADSRKEYVLFWCSQLTTSGKVFKRPWRGGQKLHTSQEPSQLAASPSQWPHGPRPTLLSHGDTTPSTPVLQTLLFRINW